MPSVTLSTVPIQLASQVPSWFLSQRARLMQQHKTAAGVYKQALYYLISPVEKALSRGKCQLVTGNPVEPWAPPAQHLPGYPMILTPEA